MRKRYRVLLLAALVAALIVPLGFALSVNSKPAAASAPQPSAGSVVVSAINGPLVSSPVAATSALPPVADSAKLMMVGAALIGLAAVVRRAG
jgi:hypothetical protein